MQPYMFVIKSVPLPENHNYNKVGGARVHIWVFSDNQDHALGQAFDYIKQFRWNPLTVEYAFEILPEHIPSLHKDEADLYRKALSAGIAADFLGWLKDEAPSDYPSIIWRP